MEVQQNLNRNKVETIQSASVSFIAVQMRDNKAGTCSKTRACEKSPEFDGKNISTLYDYWNQLQ